ncbi:MAG: sulfur carrier protein ThiS [Planctomycetota bacterium]
MSRAERAEGGPSVIALTVNGQRREFAAGTTVSALLQQLGLTSERVAVERNQALVPRAQHAATALEQDDVVEVVTLVGGG